MTMFSEFDADQDGQITRDEFISAVFVPGDSIVLRTFVSMCTPPASTAAITARELHGREEGWLTVHGMTNPLHRTSEEV